MALSWGEAPPTGLEPVTLRIPNPLLPSLLIGCRAYSWPAQALSPRASGPLVGAHSLAGGYPGVSRDSAYPRPMARPPMSLGTSGVIRTYRTRVGWRARTTYRDFDGVTREVQRHGRTEAMAKRALAEALRDRARYDGGAEIRPDMRVVALAEAWFQSVQDGDRSATTLAQYRYRLDHQVVPALGELRVRELTAGTLDRHLTAIGKKHGAATAKTVRTVCWACAAWQPATTPWSGTRFVTPARSRTGRRRHPGRSAPPRPDSSSPYSLTMTRPCAATSPTSWRSMVGTGCRVDFDRHLVVITGTVTRVNGKGLTVSRTKTAASSRMLRLPEWLLEVLRIRVNRFAQSDDPVFPAPLGGLRDPSNTQADLREGIRWNSVSGLSPATRCGRRRQPCST